MVVDDEVGDGGIDKGRSEGKRLKGGISMSSTCSISCLLLVLSAPFRGPAPWDRAGQPGDLTQLGISSLSSSELLPTPLAFRLTTSVFSNRFSLCFELNPNSFFRASLSLDAWASMPSPPTTAACSFSISRSSPRSAITPSNCGDRL